MVFGEDDDVAGIEDDFSAAVEEAEEVFEGGEAVDLATAAEGFAGFCADALEEVRLIVGDDAAIDFIEHHTAPGDEAKEWSELFAVVFDAGGVVLGEA